MKEIFIVSTHVSPIFDPYVYKVVKFFIRPNNNLTEISWEKSTLRLNIEEVRGTNQVPKIFFEICQSVKTVTWKN